MAREPYRSQMLSALLALPTAEDQAAALREFVVNEAGADHGDVAAAENMQHIVDTYTAGRTGWPNQAVLDQAALDGKAYGLWGCLRSGHGGVG